MIIFSKGGRHCDERCYNARWVGCSCICGGKNHGVGREHATKERDLGIYGDTPREQAEGLRHELEHEGRDRRHAMSESFKKSFTGGIDAYPTKGAEPEQEDDRSFEAWTDFILKKEEK